MAYAAVALLVAAAGTWLLFRAGVNIVQATVHTTGSEATALIVIESIGLLAISLVAFEIAQTIVDRDKRLSSGSDAIGEMVEHHRKLIDIREHPFFHDATRLATGRP